MARGAAPDLPLATGAGPADTHAAPHAEDTCRAQQDAPAPHQAPGPTAPDIWAAAIAGSGTGVWDRNAVTGEIWYSPSWHAILGYADQELSNRIEVSYTRVHPDDLAYVQATIQAHFDGKTESYEVEHRLRCKDGSYKWVLTRGKVVSRDTTGRALRMIGTTTDVTATRTLSETLQRSVTLITDLTNQIPGLVFQYRRSAGGRAGFSYASVRLWDIYEVTPEQIADSDAPILDRIHPEDRARYQMSLAVSAAGLTPWHLEFRTVLPVQGIRWRQAAAQPTRLPDGGTVWHGLITDITERKQMENELKKLARIDDLTQLPNRRHFRDRMEAELRRLKLDDDDRTAVIMMDIDCFKTVNDTSGHTVGDAVIRHFAEALRKNLRKDDIVGRLGGDEFAVVLPSAGLREAVAFAKRTKLELDGTPAVVNGNTMAFTVSIGITTMDGTNANTDEPLARADTALYRAKERGRNRIEVNADCGRPGCRSRGSSGNAGDAADVVRYVGDDTSDARR